MSITSPAALEPRGRVVAYWVTTSLLSAECIAGGAMGAMRLDPFIGIIRHLGYPAYFMTILGIWYVLAGLTLLVPHFPLLKEWAYAGLFFNYSGAFVSHIAAGDQASALVAPIVFTGLVASSWVLRPRNRRVQSGSLP